MFIYALHEIRINIHVRSIDIHINQRYVIINCDNVALFDLVKNVDISGRRLRLPRISDTFP